MTENQTDKLDSSNLDEHHNGINFLELAILFIKNVKLILGVTLAGGVLSAGLSMLIPNTFTGVAKILPPQSNQSSSVNAVMLAQLGGLAGVGGGALGMKDPNALYITMMKSRAVTEKIVQRFDLQKAYGTKTLTDTLNVLESVSRIGAGKDGVLAIEVDDRVPERAAALANAYVDELNKFMQTLALTEAAQRRKFFETQLKSAKDRLTDAELLLDRTPNTSLQYMDARRNLKFEESVYEVLVKQFEIAKLDESKDSPLIQVLDKAITPEKKSKPKRTVIVVLSIVLAFIASVLWLFFREMFLKNGRLSELRMRLGIEK